jgi:hypothetical protein
VTTPALELEGATKRDLDHLKVSSLRDEVVRGNGSELKTRLIKIMERMLYVSVAIKGYTKKDVHRRRGQEH